MVRVRIYLFIYLLRQMAAGHTVIQIVIYTGVQKFNKEQKKHRNNMTQVHRHGK